MFVARFFGLVALPALAVACLASSETRPGELVVGVQAEDFGGMFDSVRIVATIDGRVSSDQTVRFGPSSPAGLPTEISMKGASGARAEVVVEATANVSGNVPLSVVTRRASTTLFPEGKKLLRVLLETRCEALNRAGGPPPAPTCEAPLTCVGGRCAPEEVPVDQLEDYDSSWASSPPDFCRPARHGAPELFLGTGQTDFAPLADGQTLQLERGPQGGHHIWIATRMKNLRRSGSRTTIGAKLVDNPASPIAPAAYVFTYDRDEGNYCKLWGLRFQLDNGAVDLGADYKRFLGKKLEVTVEVVDSTNAKATSTKTIQIADTLLCPDGTTTSCN